jgi:hypothetical protein
MLRVCVSACVVSVLSLSLLCCSCVHVFLCARAQVIAGLFAEELESSMRDLVDLLVGWSLDPEVPERARLTITGAAPSTLEHHPPYPKNAISALITTLPIEHLHYLLINYKIYSLPTISIDHLQYLLITYITYYLPTRSIPYLQYLLPAAVVPRPDGCSGKTRLHSADARAGSSGLTRRHAATGTFSNFKHLWRAHVDFAQSLLHKLLSDMEAYILKSALWTVCV